MCSFYWDFYIAAGSSKNNFPGLTTQLACSNKAGEWAFVEARQLIALLNLFLELTFVQSGLRRTHAVTVSNQRFEKATVSSAIIKTHRMIRAWLDYALVEAKLIVAYM